MEWPLNNQTSKRALKPGRGIVEEAPGGKLAAKCWTRAKRSVVEENKERFQKKENPR